MNSRRNSLIADALMRAVATEKDVPDFDMLADKQRVPQLDVTDWGTGQKISAMALPNTEGVKFTLLSKADIQRRANEEAAPFAYLAIGRVALQASAGTICVGIQWAIPEPPNSTLVVLAGGAYELRYAWRRGRWVFDRVLGVGVS